MALSAISKTTAGGCCSFGILCKGTSSYTFNKLIDLTEKKKGENTKVESTQGIRSRKSRGVSLDEATNRLIKHVDSCIHDIEFQSDRKVKRFYIGKTLVHKKKRETFHHMRSSTWRLSDGISKRFKVHREKGYGRHGLVVLAMVSRATLPSNVNRNKSTVRQELYALALESRLIQHYLIEKDDPRIANTSLDAGGKDGNRSIGYPLYMAFELEEAEDENLQSE